MPQNTTASSLDNVYTMGEALGTITTLDESPPSFAYLAMQDPTAFNASALESMGKPAGTIRGPWGVGPLPTPEDKVLVPAVT